MSERRHIAKATSVLAGSTLASRVLGLVRDMVIALAFGAGRATDAFFVAFTLPNLLRRFFAEGSLTAAFVPQFTRVQQEQGAAKAYQFFCRCWSLLWLVMLLVTLAGMLAAPLLVALVGGGFVAIPGKMALTVELTRIMFPYLLCVSLLALAAGVLNVRGHFAVPALAPVLLNIAMIAAALWGTRICAEPIKALAWGVLLGGLLQLLLPFPVLLRYGLRPCWRWDFREPAVLRTMRLMGPGVAGVAIYQINVMVTRLLSSFLAQGSVSYLYYAQRMFEFPQGVFVVSLGQAVLPSLSRDVAASGEQSLKPSLLFAARLMVLVTLPAALGLALCAQPLYSLFFMRGQFDWPAVEATAQALVAYAPGLVAVGLSRILVPAFFALEDTKTPVKVSLVTLLVNALGGLIWMQGAGHVGLAAALTLASVVNAWVLAWALRRRLGALGWQPLLGLVMRLVLPMAAMAAWVLWLLHWQDWSQPGMASAKGALLAGAVVGGACVYAGGCYLLGVKELQWLWQQVRRRG